MGSLGLALYAAAWVGVVWLGWLSLVTVLAIHLVSLATGLLLGRFLFSQSPDHQHEHGDDSGW